MGITVTHENLNWNLYGKPYNNYNLHWKRSKLKMSLPEPTSEPLTNLPSSPNSLSEADFLQTSKHWVESYYARAAIADLLTIAPLTP